MTSNTAASSALTKILSELQSKPPPSASKIQSLLSAAKRQLLALKSLLPTPDTPSAILLLARKTLETGALLSIHLGDSDAFVRYYQQLLPFYELPESAYRGDGTKGQRSKITGLYLLLLLTRGDYAGFHTVLEGLEVEEAGGGIKGEGGGRDEFIQYPVKLERWLMEGSYDRVWAATKREGVPSEEFGAFSQTLVGTIRDEIASCSEKAYPSLPIANAKNLLFLENEGGVIRFAEEHEWVVQDGRVYFPLQQEDARTEKEILNASGEVIEHTIGYARELETIV